MKRQRLATRPVADNTRCPNRTPCVSDGWARVSEATLCERRVGEWHFSDWSGFVTQCISALDMRGHKWSSVNTCSVWRISFTWYPIASDSGFTSSGLRFDYQLSWLWPLHVLKGLSTVLNGFLFFYRIRKRTIISIQARSIFSAKSAGIRKKDGIVRYSWRHSRL